MHAHFLALEKEFGLLFIYVNTLEVKHSTHVLHWVALLGHNESLASTLICV